MLTKLLRGEEVDSAQPIAWSHAGGSTVAKPTTPVIGSRPGTPLYQGSHQQDSNQADSNQGPNPQQTIAVLQARVAELEGAIDRRVRETRETSLREGENAGKIQAAAQLAPVLEKLAHSIHQVGELCPKLRHQAEGDILKLSLAIARKVLHRELSMDHEAIAGLIRVAIEKIRLQEIVRVRVHPQHQQAVQQALARLSQGNQIETASDPSLPIGGVLVETTRGDFDASVDLQLQEIERGLTDHLGMHR